MPRHARLPRGFRRRSHPQRLHVLRRPRRAASAHGHDAGSRHVRGWHHHHGHRSGDGRRRGHSHGRRHAGHARQGRHVHRDHHGRPGRRHHRDPRDRQGRPRRPRRPRGARRHPRAERRHDRRPIGARAGVAALTAIGNAVAKHAKADRLHRRRAALNPVYDNDGCLGAKINITSVDARRCRRRARAEDRHARRPRSTIANVDVKLARRSSRSRASAAARPSRCKASKATIHGDLGAHDRSLRQDRDVAADGDGRVRQLLRSMSAAFRARSRACSKDQARKRRREGADQARSRARSRRSRTTRSPVSSRSRSTRRSSATRRRSRHAERRSRSRRPSCSSASTRSSKVTGGEGGTFLTTPTTVSPTADGQQRSSASRSTTISSTSCSPACGPPTRSTSRSRSIRFRRSARCSTTTPHDRDQARRCRPRSRPAGGELELALGDLIITVQDEAGATVHQIALSVTHDARGRAEPVGQDPR